MISKTGLINAWIIYDKGMIPDCGTGENQKPATDLEIQEAGLQIEEFLQYITQSSKLDSGIEEAMEQIGRYYAICSNPYVKTFAKHDPNFNTIRQHIINQKEKIEDDRLEVYYARELQNELHDKNNKLDKVREVLKQTVLDTPIRKLNEYFSYEAIELIKQILGDEKNE
jgi:hypothetical protein